MTMNGNKNEVMSFSGIDRKSFILGMVTAFAECVANECKKAALSPPFYPEDYETVLWEIGSIAEDQGKIGRASCRERV